MADFFKGLSGGLQTGFQIGQAMRERNQREELAQAYAKPEEFTDYTPDQQNQIRGLQGSGGYDVSAMPGAEGQAPTLRYTPKQGLDLQGDTAAAPGSYIDVAPQQVQRYGGQTMAGRFDPTQLRGLQMQEAARVLGSYGDVRGAAALQAQAEEQAYQAKYRPLQLQNMEGQIAGQKLTLSEAERKVKLDESNRLAGTKLAELSAAGTPIDTATANRIANETGADMKFVTEAVLGQYNLTKAAANDLIERQLVEFDKAAKGGLPTLNKYIAERLDPDKTDNIVPTVVQGKDGKLRVMYGDKPLPGYQAYGGIDQLSAAFQGNIKRDPLGAAIQISTLDTQAQARLASQASIRASDANATYYRNGGRVSGKDVEKEIAVAERLLGRKLSEAEIASKLGFTTKSNPNQTMNDKEKLDYAAYIKALAELPDTATAAEREGLAAKYRVEKFTGEGGKEPNWKNKSADAKSPDASAMRKRNVGYAGGKGTDFYSPESIASRQAVVQQQAAVADDEEASREAEFQRGLQIYNQNNPQRPTNATLLYPNRVGLTGR